MEPQCKTALFFHYIADFLQVPVIDQTQLTSTYDIAFEYSNDVKALDDPRLPPDALPRALERRLGLKLTTRKIRVATLVIDHIERPAANGK